MPDDPRLSGASIKVLNYLLNDVGAKRSGAEILAVTRLASGTLYPMLLRFEKAGWMDSEWEDSDPVEMGRPKRRYYRLSGVGQTKARRAMADLQIGGSFSWQA